MISRATPPFPPSLRPSDLGMFDPGPGEAGQTLSLEAGALPSVPLRTRAPCCEALRKSRSL